MGKRWPAVRRTAVSLLVAYLLFMVFESVLSLAVGHGAGREPVLLDVLAVVVALALSFVTTGVLRGYLPALREWLADWNWISGDWMAAHPALTAAGFAISLGAVEGAMTHSVVSALIFAVLWGGFGWFSARGERRRRRPSSS